MSKKQLIIDCQVFQTDTWNRGMGKYSFQLLRALADAGIESDRNITLLFNSSLGKKHESIDILKDTFKNPKLVFAKLHTPSDLVAEDGIAKNKLILDGLFSGLKDTTEYLILSLLETNTFVVFPENTINYLLFYDLIPLLFAENYLPDTGAQENYFRRFTGIFQADKIFTISQTTLDDLVVHLNITPEWLVNLDGAPIPRVVSNTSQPNVKNIREKKYILFPSGDDIRKNNERAVNAFNLFNKAHSDEYILVITSRFSPKSRHRLNQLSENIEFVGNISEQELLWLYQNCALVFFPPEYEGLGLPVLEAVNENKKVVCSDIRVFREISADAFYYCDAYSISSMKDALTEAISDEKFLRNKVYAPILDKYTWVRSAKLFMENVNLTGKSKTLHRQKVAIIGPDPSGYSSIGKSMQQAHHAASKMADITYFLEKSPSSRHDKPAFLGYVADCRRIYDFNVTEYKSFDQVIYHIGSSDYHIQSIKKALCFPGKLVLHDTDMKGIIDYFLTNGHMSSKRFKLEERITNIVKDRNKLKPTVGYAVSLINSHHSIVTHSQYAYKAVESSKFFGQKLTELQLPVGTPSSIRTDQVAKANKVNIGLAGILSDSKGLSILEMLLESGQLNKANVYVFGYDFATTESKLASITKYPNVTVITNLTDHAFQSQLASLDILLNYRTYYHGEASQATIEAMRYGVVPIVRDIGWFSELPTDTVVKIERIEDISKAIVELLENAELRRDMSLKAEAFTASNCRADEYFENILNLRGGGRLTEVVKSIHLGENITPASLAGMFKEALK